MLETYQSVLRNNASRFHSQLLGNVLAAVTVALFVLEAAVFVTVAAAPAAVPLAGSPLCLHLVVYH